jgi:hypothetical protein
LLGALLFNCYVIFFAVRNSKLFILHKNNGHNVCTYLWLIRLDFTSHNTANYFITSGLFYTASLFMLR